MTDNDDMRALIRSLDERVEKIEFLMEIIFLNINDKNDKNKIKTKYPFILSSDNQKKEMMK